MAYTKGSPNGSLYVGRVKFGKDYKHTVLFANEEKRNTFFTTSLKKVKSNVIYYNPNNYIDVDGTIKGLDMVNYCFFNNDTDIGDLWYPCFVESYEYVAKNTTRLYIKLDIFQMYIYQTDFQKCLIKRGHTPDDTLYKWLAPEPVSVKPDVQNQITTILPSADWAPQWVLHCASYFNTETGMYEYSGTKTDNTFGEYGKYIDDMDKFDTLLKNYGKKSLNDVADSVGVTEQDDKYDTVVAELLTGAFAENLSENIGKIGTLLTAYVNSGLQDHRDELIGLYAIPKWARHPVHPWATNDITNKSVNVTLDRNTLACGYTPRNKKMLTSMCKAYGIFNNNGFMLSLKPELFTNSTPEIILSCCPMGTQSYYMYLADYNKLTDACHQINYNCERRVGYDANTGMNKAINILTSSLSMVSSVGQLAGGIASGNPMNMIGGGSNVVTSGLNMVDALGQQGASIGTNGDLLSVTNGHATLRFISVSPLENECKLIDDFLDTYGYEIDEHDNPRNWFNTRPQWNFIQTENINLTAPAPANYVDELKNIFNKGITLWHNYDNMGNYDLNNQPT